MREPQRRLPYDMESSIDPSYFTQEQLQSSSRPPQIFGSYAPDGSVITPALPPGSYFADDPNSFFALEDGQDHNDPKRRRIARACDSCRKKKIKCDGKMPACTHCQTAKTECIFTHIEKKRNPPKGAKYIEALENRLGRMESLLRMSGLFDKDDEKNTDLGALEQRLAAQAAGNGESSPSRTDHSRRVSQGPETQTISPRLSEDLTVPTPNSGKQSPSQDRQEKEALKEHALKQDEGRERSEVETLSDMMCSLVTNTHGETRYIGSSSGFSIFSPRGIQWVNEKTGDRSFEKMIYDAALDDNKWYHWRPEIFGDIFARRVFKELPPRHECLSLLKDFFENFNMLFPLFHEPTFMHLVDRQYSDDPYDSSGWWASLNVAIAIAYRLRVMSNLNPGDEDAAAWAYFKNALAVQTELTLRNTDLLSVQALLGMALFLQGTPNPQPTFTLVAAAIRLAHGIGLHKRGSGFGLNPVEVEQRKRVFWIAYLVDKDISLRSGRPPSQDEEDWNVDLPSEDPDDDVGNVPLSDGKTKCNIFRLMCSFGLILAKVYRQLYSVKASKQSDGELLNTIGELDRELEEWKDSIPIDFRPEHDINACNSSLVMHVVCLHFSYYNCLTTIHRMAVHHGYWTSRLSNYAMQGLNVRPLNPRVFSSAALCVSAARASINLVKYIPQGDYACVWLVLYYPVSSLVTLFANILQNPQDARARSDLKLMHVVTDFLSKICNEESTGSLHRTYAICTEFERIANVVLSKAERDMSVRQKRKADKDREKAEARLQQERHGLHSPQQQNFNTPIDHLRASTSTAGTAMSPALAAQQPPLNANPMNPHDSSVPNTSARAPNPLGPNGNAGGWLNDLSKLDFTSGLPDSPSMAHFVNGYGEHRAGSSDGGYNNAASSNSPVAGGATSPLNFGNSFQQPFVPQDLWSMPMTFEWDWAGVGDMGATGSGPGGMGMALDDPTGGNNGNTGNGGAFGQGTGGSHQ